MDDRIWAGSILARLLVNFHIGDEVFFQGEKNLFAGGFASDKAVILVDKFEILYIRQIFF